MIFNFLFYDDCVGNKRGIRIDKTITTKRAAILEIAPPGDLETSSYNDLLKRIVGFRFSTGFGFPSSTFRSLIPSPNVNRRKKLKEGI